MLVNGGFASLRFVFAQRDCLAAPMVCQGVGLEVQTDCLEMAFWIAWGLPRDPGIGNGLLGDYLGDAFGLPRDCPGIGRGFMAESVWVFCRKCLFL